MFNLFGRIKRLFFFYSEDPLFRALEEYHQRTHREIAEFLTRPRQKSQFEKDCEQHLKSLRATNE